ncbi:MAG: Minf_1886 family protein [Kiritimatiellia bacterium]
MTEQQQREIIRNIVRKDKRYREEAYTFVREGLDYTVHELKDPEKDQTHHVRGWELSKGIRDYAIREYGPVSLRVLRHWGIQSSEDIGEIVYNMIDAQLLGKTDEDEKEDFRGVFDFEQAFRDPFLPAKPLDEAVE